MHPIIKAAQRKGFYVKSNGDPQSFLYDILNTAKSNGPFTQKQFDDMVASVAPAAGETFKWINQIPANVDAFGIEQLEYLENFYAMLGILENSDRQAITEQPIAARYCERMAEKMKAATEVLLSIQELNRVMGYKR